MNIKHGIEFVLTFIGLFAVVTGVVALINIIISENTGKVARAAAWTTLTLMFLALLFYIGATY